MTSPLDDASLPNNAEELAAQLTEIEARQRACLKEIQELMQSEDPAKGVFHAAAIHAMKQTNMMLRYQKDLRVARINQLRLAGGVSQQ